MRLNRSPSHRTAQQTVLQLTMGILPSRLPGSGVSISITLQTYNIPKSRSRDSSEETEMQAQTILCVVLASGPSLHSPCQSLLAPIPTPTKVLLELP